MPDAHVAWPTEIKVQENGRRLKVLFDDGASFDLPAELLRVASPSAEVQGHSRKERRLVGGKRNVAIVAVDPIGSYAVKLGFEDGHNKGLHLDLPARARRVAGGAVGGLRRRTRGQRPQPGSFWRETPDVRRKPLRNASSRE